MGNLLQDLRYGLRMLAKNPGFTAVAVFTLALGIGATSAIFSVVYGVLLRPLPYPKPNQILDLRELNAKGGTMSFADPNFDDVREQSRSLQGVAEYGAALESVSGGAEPSRAMVATVSDDFFSVIGVQPFLGRGIAPAEQKMGAPLVGLISYGFWKQNLDGAPDFSAIKLKIGDVPCSVIGVLPPGFRFPFDSDVWLPRGRYEKLPSRTAHNWHVLARQRDEVPLTQTRAELSGIARRLMQQYGRDTMMVDIAAMPLRESLTSHVRQALIVLLAAVGFLLLIACANVANLQLAQAASRTRELAIRTALGARRSRLLRQFLAEALLLSVAGGTLGIFAALWGVDTLGALAPKNLPRLEDVSVNWPVLLFSLGVSVAVAVGLGLFTALRAGSRDLQGALLERGEGGIGVSNAHRLSRMIVAGQVSITLVLLVGAGLLGRSLLRVLSVDPGFHTNSVLTMDLSMPFPKGIAGGARRVQLLDELFARLRGMPGVLDVGGTSRLPLGTGFSPDGIYVLMNPDQVTPRMNDLITRSLNGSLETDPALLKEFSSFFENLFHDPDHTGDADYIVASDGYFRALGIPLLQGRYFNDGDSFSAPQVALVSASLAREKWPHQDPLGHSIEFGNMDGDVRLLTVVGVVGDVREGSLETEPRPTIYVNLRQRPQAASRMTVVMQTRVPPATLIPVARQTLRALDPEIPPSFSTFTQVFSASLQSRRFSLTLIGVFAAAALLLAVAGIYGVMAYSVARRTREFGIRIALGARAGDVLRLVLRQGAWTALIGLAVGLLGSIFLTRAVQSMLFGVSATDPVTLASVVLLLVGMALLACYVPARRATKVDPMVALRYE